MGTARESDAHGAWPRLAALVSHLIDTRAEIAALQAQEATLLSAAVDLVSDRVRALREEGRARLGDDLPLREVCAELATAMRVSDRTVQARMSDAAALVERFPATLGALRAGRVDAGHASVIVDAGIAIDDAELRGRYERIVLEVARHESVPRTRVAARSIAARLDPAVVDERAARAHERRAVRVMDLDDGMARLLADLPATLAHAIHDRLTQMAHEVRSASDGAGDRSTADGGAENGGAEEASSAGLETETPGETDETDETTDAPALTTGPARHASASAGAGAPGSPAIPVIDTRTMDELRADILADLLLAGAPGAHGPADALAMITARVQVTVPVLTLAGTSDQPALLAGHGPIDADTARRLAAGAPGWDRVMTHPHTGLPLAVDRYRPSAELRRFLRARDEHCRFPGCRLAPWRCDLDHTVDAASGGPTTAENLAHTCRRHHTLKHATRWTVRQRGGGVLEWTSPTGRTYRDRPAPTVRFVPDAVVTDTVMTDAVVSGTIMTDAVVSDRVMTDTVMTDDSGPPPF